MTPAALFDAAGAPTLEALPGETLKETGMAEALGGALESWKAAFRAEVARLATTGQPFTSETVVARVGLPAGVIALSANNAVGAMVNAAARTGVIRKTGRRVHSTRPSSHAAELTEWIGK